MNLPDSLNYPRLHFNLKEIIAKKANSEVFLTVPECRELLLDKENIAPGSLDTRNKKLLYKRVLNALYTIRETDKKILIVEAQTIRKTKQLKIYYLQLC